MIVKVGLKYIHFYPKCFTVAPEKQNFVYYTVRGEIREELLLKMFHKLKMKVVDEGR
jgi:hypothetical protein